MCTLVLLAWKGYTLLTFACRPNQFDGIEATFVLFCDFACCHVIKISDPRRNTKGGTPLHPSLSCPPLLTITQTVCFARYQQRQVAAGRQQFVDPRTSSPIPPPLAAYASALSLDPLNPACALSVHVINKSLTLPCPCVCVKMVSCCGNGNATPTELHARLYNRLIRYRLNL